MPDNWNKVKGMMAEIEKGCVCVCVGREGSIDLILFYLDFLVGILFRNSAYSSCSNIARIVFQGILLLKNAVSN